MDAALFITISPRKGDRLTIEISLSLLLQYQKN